MADPMQALRKAGSIGPSQEDVNAPGAIQQGVMPLTLGGVQGMSSILEGLKGMFSSGAAPEAVQAVGRGFPSATETLGEVHPEYTPVGGEDMYNMGHGVSRPPTPPSMNPMEDFYAKNPMGQGRMTGQFQEAPGGLSNPLHGLKAFGR